MTEQRGDKDRGASGVRPDAGGIHSPECPACLETRHEIMMAVFHEAEVVAGSVSIHLAECPSCREWEADLRRMHSICECAGEGAAPAGLTEAALSAPAAAPDARGLRASPASLSRDRGALAVSLVFIVLANAGLAALLEGSARVLYPAVTLAAMLVATLWVFFDSRGRGARGGFWTALQPLTVPAGLVAYIVCRDRESMRCPECGALCHAQDRHCRRCGRRLQDVCCRCGKTVRREFRICPWCGTPLAECFLRDGSAGASCGWTGAQKAFVAGANAALLAALLAVLFGGGDPAWTAAASLYLAGMIPVFNWAAFDARRRAMDTIGWGMLALLAGYAGLVVYLACRQPLVSQCPVCGSFPPSSFSYCPCCGSLMNPACPRCGAAGAGSYCASCGAPLSGGG